jgi:NAD(P)-dependent dehydrogenase (short-subunit alcohol dehydrogenase family)
MADWTFEDAPDQTGRTAIVTGANAGIGYETARMLALRGAIVVLACRDPEKGKSALERITRERPDAKLELASLDLSDLASVGAFAAQFERDHQRLDLLINNAGVMIPPFSRTAQGFELQFGTNHLGHFALSARLWPLLSRTADSRLVVVSSSAAHQARIDFSDLNFERRPYRPWSAYAQSKLANSLFALELARRAGTQQSHVVVSAAHPGWTATELQRNSSFIQRLNPLFAMTPAEGALPTLRAAVDPRVGNGSYWGPSRLFEVFGPPRPARIPRRARDAAVAQRLWEVSERLTGLTFEPTSVQLRAVV